jgi:hypothetical protein
VLKRDLLGNVTVLDTFPPIPNVWTAFPPFIDYVPTKIVNNPSGGFYLCNLTGFPFIGSISQVLSIDTAGMDSVFATGISQAVDMQVDSVTGDLYVLRFGIFDSTAMPVPGSAMLTRLHNGVMDTMIMNFGPSAGLALDTPMSFYVTDIFSGSVLHIQNTTGLNENSEAINALSVSPNPAQENFSISLQLASPAGITWYIHDVAGKEVYKKSAGNLPAGRHTFYDEDSGKLNPGFYLVSVDANGFASSVKLVIY